MYLIRCVPVEIMPRLYCLVLHGAEVVRDHHPLLIKSAGLRCIVMTWLHLVISRTGSGIEATLR
jgi:hypothetical protein